MWVRCRCSARRVSPAAAGLEIMAPDSCPYYCSPESCNFLQNQRIKLTNQMAFSYSLCCMVCWHLSWKKKKSFNLKCVEFESSEQLTGNKVRIWGHSKVTVLGIFLSIFRLFFFSSNVMFCWSVALSIGPNTNICKVKFIALKLHLFQCLCPIYWTLVWCVYHSGTSEVEGTTAAFRVPVLQNTGNCR